MYKRDISADNIRDILNSPTNRNTSYELEKLASERPLKLRRLKHSEPYITAGNTRVPVSLVQFNKERNDSI